MYRDGDRHTWRGFLGLIDDEIKAICRSRAVLLRVRAPFRLWIVGENKREHMHVHTRKYTVRSSSMSISFANSFFFSHIEYFIYLSREFVYAVSPIVSNNSCL